MTLRLESYDQFIDVDTHLMQVNQFLTNSTMPHVFIPSYSTSQMRLRATDNVVSMEQTLAKNSPTGEYSRNGNNLQNTYIKDNFEGQFPTYLLSYLELLFENMHADNLIATIHSSAVQGINANLLFIGEAGAGKTSVMLNLVEQYGCKYLSNNKTLLASNSSPRVLGGTQAITVRNRDQFNKYEAMSTRHEATPYGRISFILNPTYHADMTKNNHVVLVLPRINPGVREFMQLSPDEAKIRLYPYFLNSTDREVTLFKHMQPVDSDLIMNDHRRKILLDGMNNVLSKTSVYHISGSLDFICDKVASLDEKV